MSSNDSQQKNSSAAADIDTQYDAIAKRLHSASSVCVLTGAGISAESGIATFRDAQSGLWANYSVQDLATEQAFRRNRAMVWQWYQWRRQQVNDAQPNAGHVALCRLATLNNDLTLVTQNVDGLHQRAGSADVVEFHGNLFANRCLDHGHPIQCDDHQRQQPPTCPKCNSHARPGVIWFGETLDAQIIERSTNAAIRCQVFLSIGTSSLVYPAADLAHNALQGGAVLIEINPEETPLSRFCDQVVRASAAVALPAIVDRVEAL